MLTNDVIITWNLDLSVPIPTSLFHYRNSVGDYPRRRSGWVTRKNLIVNLEPMSRLARRVQTACEVFKF
jgi:hypothetical protein